LVKWAAVQPLIGGMAIGAYEAIGSLPDALYSYSFAGKNDSHIREYWKDVPYRVIDQEGLETSPVDIVVGVPVCSALSSLNPNSSPDYHSVKNVYESAEFALDHLTPEVALFENAPALFTKKGEKVLANLMEIGRARGYSLTVVKTNTLLHGIPQNRMRTFYFFWRSKDAAIVNYMRADRKNLVDYLGDIPEGTSYTDVFPQPKPLEESPYYRFMLSEFGENFREVVTRGKNAGSLFGLCYRGNPEYFDKIIEFLDKQGLCETDIHMRCAQRAKKKFSLGLGVWDPTPMCFREYINAVQGRVVYQAIHPREDRWFTVREFMHLMGLPHDFQLVGGQYNHIAQNVPVTTARDMVLQAVEFLEGRLPLGGPVVKLDNVKGSPAVTHYDIGEFF
jgi:site-specific DNA-cytosine methylase